MNIYKLYSTLALCFITIFGYSQLVSSEVQLRNAINAAQPGATIILANGIWEDVFIDIDKFARASAPITITAQQPGAVFMTGNSRVLMEGAYITVTGLVFQDPSNLVVSGSNIEPIFEINECNNCKVIGNKIDGYNGTEAQKELTFKWIFLDDSPYAEIAYNSFIGKYGIGSIINDNRQSGNPNYLRIHHNYFASRRPINGINDDNDQDAIRIGTSTTSLSNSFSEVYENYFYDFFGEVEIISNKSGENKYYNNTFRDYGGCLTLRHGDNCEVFGNYFFAENNFFTGGVRVIGEGHKVYNNYIEGTNFRKPNGSSSNVTGGINVMNGRLNSELNGYYQVKNAQIINNTFVDCDYALRIGTSLGGNDQEPINLTVANNIMYNTSIDAYQITTAPSGNSISEGNIFDIPATDIADDGIFHRLTEGSSAIDAGVGNYDFLTRDILGGNRDRNFDTGAEEFGTNGINLPYNAEDVGEKVGFGASASPQLEVSPDTLSFGLFGGSATFEINSNVDWEIKETVSWASFDLTVGSGRNFVTITVDENTFGRTRVEEFFIDEVGGSGLSTSLTVEQTDIFIPVEIPIAGTTSIGMQDKDDIEEVNAYNDDFSNYWTGNPDTDPEVSITFDLSCIHELSEIGINFWKADERTTTFSIAVADEAAGPFITILEEVESEIGSVDTEQIFSLDGTFARYVKFIGIGNSSSSNWTSIANVNIYGNPNCEDASSIFENQNLEDINIFPVPADEQLTISSISKKIESIEIFNVAGQKVLTAEGAGEFSKQIDISELTSGVYILKIEKIGFAKFLVK